MNSKPESVGLHGRKGGNVTLKYKDLEKHITILVGESLALNDVPEIVPGKR